MSVCHICRAAATHLITGRGTGTHRYRAATTCPTHKTQTRTWVARAGPPTETPTSNKPEPQPRLF